LRDLDRAASIGRARSANRCDKEGLMRSIKHVRSAAIAAAVILVSSTAAADPIDNPGYADFIFYNNPGVPFLTFASTEEVASYIPGIQPSFFEAEILFDGTMIYDQHSMESYDTALAFSGTPLKVQVDIDDVVGFVDLSGASPYLEWDVTARLRFSGAGGATLSNCRTAYFTATIIGDWGNVESAAFIIPALTGSGSGACNGHAATINAHFDLGVSGSTLALYKFKAIEQATGFDLSGS
jgi:hypothetical protein